MQLVDAPVIVILRMRQNTVRAAVSDGDSNGFHAPLFEK